MLSRKPQKAVRSTDPGQSGLWLIPPATGIAVGASIPYLTTHNTAWTTAGGLIGAAIGGTATATPKFREWISTRSRMRHIIETAGALTNINEEPLEALRVHQAYRNITEFVHRDIQDLLIEHLRNRIPVLIEGPSMAGKTRLVIEAIRAEWPNAPILFPRNENDIEILLNNHLEPTSETVIILDDMDRFLNNQSITLGILNRWINNGCTVVGTMTQSAYFAHRTNDFEKLTGWDSVNRFQTLHLSDLLSQNEFNTLANTSYSSLAKEIRGFGLGPTLSCAQDIRGALQEERAAKTQCSALIKAASDWKRLGLGPASKAQLTSLAEIVYYNNNSHLNWDEAWTKATTPINSVAPFIKRVSDDEWEVLDFIADRIAGNPISSDCLSAISTFELNASQTLIMAIKMFMDGNLAVQIEEMYTRSILANPDNIKLLGNYVKFLDNIQRKASYLHDTPNMTTYDCISSQCCHILSSCNLSIESPKSLTETCSTTHPLPKEHTILQIDSIEMDAMLDGMSTTHRWGILNRHSISSLGGLLKTFQLKWITKRRTIHPLRGRPKRIHRRIKVHPISHIFDIDNVSCERLYDTVHTKDVYDYIISSYPYNSDILGYYAKFLESAFHDIDNVDKTYRLALKIDPTDVYTICNYALFLSNEKKDHFHADQLYKQALKIDPRNAYVTRTYYRIYDSSTH